MTRLTDASFARAKARLGTVPAEVTDRSPWYWYAESGSCGVPPR